MHPVGMQRIVSHGTRHQQLRRRKNAKKNKDEASINCRDNKSKAFPALQRWVKLAALYMRQVVLSRQHHLSHKAQSILVTKLSLHDSDINSVQSYAIARWSRFCLA
jgi:hypothetical protein